MPPSPLHPDRRRFLGTSLLAASATAAGAGFMPGAAGAQAIPTPAPASSRPMVVGDPDMRGVSIERVTYPNIAANTVIAANLFKPAGFDGAKRHAAIVVGHPFGGVKEQTAGLHALKLAQMGFVTLSFDASHYGDSSGEPRYTEVPATRVGDYSAGVDFFSRQPFVDPGRIGVLGVCGGGGYAVSAAAIDHRIRAIATVSMYDMGRARRQGLGDSMSYEQRMKLLDEIAQQRSIEAAGGTRRDIRALPTQPATAATPAIVREFLAYYDTPRGKHPNSTGWYAFTSLAPMMNFFPFVQAETISPRPLLMVVGEKAESAYFSQDAYKKAAEPKELFVVPGATHVDLYDNPRYTALSVERLGTFFRQHLA